MYKLTNYNTVLLIEENRTTTIPRNTDHRFWKEFQKWESEGGIPEPADPEPKSEAPEPTVSDVIEAIDAKDKGNSAKWHALKR